jgi:hypothetical protein
MLVLLNLFNLNGRYRWESLPSGDYFKRKKKISCCFQNLGRNNGHDEFVNIRAKGW